MWLAVHLVYLPGYRSRLLVLINWLHAYLLGDRAVRLILKSKANSSHNYQAVAKTNLHLPKLGRDRGVEGLQGQRRNPID